MAIILKNNKSKYVLVDFDEYEEIQAMMNEKVKNNIRNSRYLINENLEAFKELA